MSRRAAKAGKTRHPSSRWRPDLARMQARVAERLAGEGHPWPELAAAVLAHRGHLGLDRAGFAEAMSAPIGLVEAIEEGAWNITA